MQRLIKKILVAPGSYDEFIEKLRTACPEHRKLWLWNVIELSYSKQMWDSFTTEYLLVQVAEGELGKSEERGVCGVLMSPT